MAMSKSEEVIAALGSVLSSKVSESVALNEDNLQHVVAKAAEAASKIWDSYLKSKLEPSLKDMGFSRKSFEADFESGTFEVEYLYHEINSKIHVSGSVHSDKHSSHHTLQFELYGPYGLIEEKEVTSFGMMISLVREAIGKL